MKNTIMILIAAICSLSATSPATAQEADDASKINTISATETFRHSVNMCPGGIVFGIYSMNYEYLLSPSHGLVGRLEYEAIPKTYTDADIDANGVAFTLNYRWHLSGEMESLFLGAYSRYRHYQGKGTLESTKFDFDIPDVTLGLNIGKRWVWIGGLNITFALGYGFSIDDRNTLPTSIAIESSIDTFQDEYDFFNPFLGEISIGYTF